MVRKRMVSSTISATSEGPSGTATVTVTQAPPPPAPVATVTIALSSASVIVGQAAQATATLRDASCNVLTGRSVAWSSSNTDVITATSEGKSGSATLTVNAPTPPPPDGGTAPEPGVGDVIVWQDNVDKANATLATAACAKRGNIQLVDGHNGNGIALPVHLGVDRQPDREDLRRPAGDRQLLSVLVSHLQRCGPSCGDRNGAGMKWFMTWRGDGHLRYTMSVNWLDGVPFQGRPNWGMEFTSHDQSSSDEPDPWRSNVNHSLTFATTNDYQWHKYTLHSSPASWFAGTTAAISRSTPTSWWCGTSSSMIEHETGGADGGRARLVPPSGLMVGRQPGILAGRGAKFAVYRARTHQCRRLSDACILPVLLAAPRFTAGMSEIDLPLAAEILARIGEPPLLHAGDAPAVELAADASSRAWTGSSPTRSCG